MAAAFKIPQMSPRVRALLAGSSMSTPDVRTRVRQRIRRLLEDRGHTNRAFATALGHKDQWASNLLAGRFPLSLDEIDAVAEFLRVPPGEIVRVADEPWELTPTEMRVIRAIRMLPPPIRDHLVILADYLVGVVPDEIDRLTKIRRLDAEDARRIDHWLDVLLLEKGMRRGAAALPDPPATVAPPASPTGHTRKPRRGTHQRG